MEALTFHLLNLLWGSRDHLRYVCTSSGRSFLTLEYSTSGETCFESKSSLASFRAVSVLRSVLEERSLIARFS